ncbi:MAG: tRNA (adenosine(37)-N6)-dimethylallyltransferase MiaA [Deferribacteraceae bacterium]|jgi:tRNA dimethylallyltransferase|nr:tRNA (adenosine(37)-N6)-dimethylallyltransferase MiaA [Deferribacteraceae bacterium]
MCAILRNNFYDDVSIPVITGATASGKSEIITALADEGVSFEVVNADAFQVYKFLDIGTAKPDPEFRKRVPHHLIDITPPDRAYTAGDFVTHAEIAIKDIISRGKLPLVTGGTGMYIQALRDGIFETPPTDEPLRNELKRRAETEGKAALHEELKKIDADAAERIHPNDLTRIIRALEVWKTTGVPITRAHHIFRKAPAFSYNIMVLYRERGDLYRDINDRVGKMLDSGWLTEVETLLGKGYTISMPSFRAIGYRELAAVVTGDMTLDSASELTERKTRNYAKRQMTWFRGMNNVTFMTAEMIRHTLKQFVISSNL